MNMLNELQTMSTTQARVLGFTFGTGLALALIGSFELGKRSTRKLYMARINELEMEKLDLEYQAVDIVDRGIKAMQHLDNTNAEDEVDEPGVSDQGESTVSVIPHFTARPRRAITKINDDITNEFYTSPGITMEDAERIVNGDMTIGDNTSYEVPEGGLWIAGYMIAGSDEDRDIHDKAVQAAKGVKPKRESKRDRIAREKREAQENKQVEE